MVLEGRGVNRDTAPFVERPRQATTIGVHTLPQTRPPAHKHAPHALHLEQVVLGVPLVPREQRDGRLRRLHLARAQQVLGRLVIDVPVPQVQLPRAVHRRRRALHVPRPLQQPCLPLEHVDPGRRVRRHRHAALHRRQRLAQQTAGLQQLRVQESRPQLQLLAAAAAAAPTSVRAPAEAGAARGLQRRKVPVHQALNRPVLRILRNVVRVLGSCEGCAGRWMLRGGAGSIGGGGGGGFEVDGAVERGEVGPQGGEAAVCFGVRVLCGDG